MAKKLTKEEEALRRRGRKEAEKRNKLIMKAERKREKAERKELKKREKEEARRAKKLAREEAKKAKMRAKKGEIVDNEQTVETPVAPEIVVVEQPVAPETPEETIEKEEAPEEKKPIKRNYHVSFRDDGKWQVKFAKGNRALKLFDTQAEAIAFAKQKAENQDGSITIHKKDGKIRKQNYSKKGEK